jgi:hypothetical protein
LWLTSFCWRSLFRLGISGCGHFCGAPEILAQVEIPKPPDDQILTCGLTFGSQEHRSIFQKHLSYLRFKRE